MKVEVQFAPKDRPQLPELTISIEGSRAKAEKLLVAVWKTVEEEWPDLKELVHTAHVAHAARTTSTATSSGG